MTRIGPMADNTRRRAELRAFLFITVILFPILAVAVVGGYGFLVWFL
ncbi:periplasmic nitrate reductase, NapE protein, partial [Photobacterium sp. MCCC 1A19761]